MKRPAFQFYPKDWRGNLKLSRCSDAAKGAWIQIMCVLHDSEEYGVARFPLSELVSSAGVKITSARELVAKGVLKGGDGDVSAYVYRPRHAGKKLDPVTLLEQSDGPMWYCSRFVRDEWIAGRRGQSTRFSADNQPPQKPRHGERQGESPTRGNGVDKTSPTRPDGERQGDGPAVASAVSTNHRSGNSSIPASDEPEAEAEINCNPETLARVVDECRRYQVHDAHDGNAVIRRWVRDGATAGQVMIAVAEARKCKPAPAMLPVGYVAKILERIVAEDAEARRVNEARAAETQRMLTEQRAQSAAPAPPGFFGNPKAASA